MAERGDTERCYLVDEGKLDAHAVRDGGRTLCTTGVGADDDGILVVGDVRLDVPFEQRPAVQVVHRNIEESLDCNSVSILLHPQSIYTKKGPRSS